MESESRARWTEMKNQINFDDLKYRREAEEFREIRARLQSAVRAIEVPDDLELRVRFNLAEAHAPAASWNRREESDPGGH